MIVQKLNMINVMSNLDLDGYFNVNKEFREIEFIKRECVSCRKKDDLEYYAFSCDKRYRHNFYDLSFFCCKDCKSGKDFYFTWDKFNYGTLNFFLLENRGLK